jgi:YVTN family beta-propeller protein
MSLRGGLRGSGVGRLIAVLAAVAGACCLAASPAAATEVINTIHVGMAPYGVSSDGTHVWVTNENQDTVSEIEASSGKVINTIDVGLAPFGVSSDGTHVWVTDALEDTVSEIEASTGKVINTIDVGNDPEGVSSDGTHVWVTNYVEDTVSEIEASTGKVINTIDVGMQPYRVSSDGIHVWVTNNVEDTVSEIEASTGKVINTIDVGSEPVGVSSDGTHVWVANIGEDTVSEIEASTGKVIDTIDVGSAPVGLSSDGTDVWVANVEERTVSEIEASTGKVIDTIDVGSYPYGVSSDGTHVWVTNLGENTVSEILISKPSFTIEKLQKIAGEASYTTSELSAKVGQRVDYEVIVKNTGNVALTFKEPSDVRCEGISPGGEQTIAAGGDETYMCSHELTSMGSYANQASIEGDEGTGTKTSNTVAVMTEPAAPSCSTVSGHGVYKKVGEVGRLRVLDSLSTSLQAPQMLRIKYETDTVHFHLLKLERASCTGEPGERDFQGEGAAAVSVKKKTGYTLSFSIREKEGGFFFSSKLMKGAEEVEASGGPLKKSTEVIH